MKNMILVLFASIATLSFGLESFAADSVSVIVNGQTYTCSQGGVGNSDCTIVQRGAVDKYGKTCVTDAWEYCAFYYEFGAVTSTDYYHSASSAANWCRNQLSGH